MRDEDVQNYRKVFPGWSKRILGEVNTIAILSPDPAQTQLINELFGKGVTDLNRKLFDLDLEPEGRFDLICAMNVFMGARDPDKWFKTILAAAKYVWIQDLILWQRGAVGAELGEGPEDDKDRMRYSMPPDHPARLPEAYDLRKLADRTLDFHVYGPDQDHKSFLIFLKGDL